MYRDFLVRERVFGHKNGLSLEITLSFICSINDTLAFCCAVTALQLISLQVRMCFSFCAVQGETEKAVGVLIPADPPCANFQFATMEGRELTCGDFHACGISAAAGL